MIEISLKSGGLPYRCIIALLNIDEFITIYKMYNRPKSACTHQNESNMNERNLSEKKFMEGYSRLQMKSDPFLEICGLPHSGVYFPKGTAMSTVYKTERSLVNDY